MASKKTNLIWDLSGTLFRPSTEGMSAEEVDQYSFLFLMWSGKKVASPLDVEALQILKFLNRPLHASEPIAYTHTGEPVPEILRLLLAGALTLTEAWSLTQQFFNEASQALTEEEASRVYRMLECFFNPLSLARCMKPIEESVKLLSQTKKQQTGHYILSNWDHDSFGPFYHTWQEALRTPFNCEDIIISADTGYVKPQKEIFAWFLAYTKLTPESCFFLDDQRENIETAASLGIEGFHLTSDTIEKAEETLRHQGLIE